MEYPDGYLLPLFSWDPQRTSTKLKLCQDQLQVIATDGSGFKSAIGDQEFTPGYKYYYEIKILKGSLIKIGVCTKNGLFQDVNSMLHLSKLSVIMKKDGQSIMVN
ncbi:unnamed protein product [Paramecium sonneborni]|uniref:B30.2/SPRY domain-containing protein n=1 Tax=Paramecium sonneborni TaxID=65129 RepID=A0A8S1MLL9_9CILI|nr:unnamed protein product [Paramecium sonneborni]